MARADKYQPHHSLVASGEDSITLAEVYLSSPEILATIVVDRLTRPKTHGIGVRYKNIIWKEEGLALAAPKAIAAEPTISQPEGNVIHLPVHAGSLAVAAAEAS